MKLHTVFITYNRLELTKQAIESYLETVSVPFSYLIVDNGSSDDTGLWLETHHRGRNMAFAVNRYPGYASNRGWEIAPTDADFLHRADNDFKFLPGWCDEVIERFQDPTLGQLGLRTDEEEQLHGVPAPFNVGGNNIIRRELWDKGLRYDERPWPEYPPGYSEDSFFSPAVEKMGYRWERVRRPCIESLASGDWSDEYYQRSYGDRHIKPNPYDPTAPGTQ
jgi:glycosyltransferase involved in cell wall biosynthesis